MNAIAWPANPIVYEINTRLWLAEMAEKHGRVIRLDTVPEEEIERLAAYGFDAVWLMGVWEPSPKGREIALHHPAARREYGQALPDWTDEDVVGSPYAVHRYAVNPALGDEAGLQSLRQRLAERGLRLILDFVPNHLALDHPWTVTHPEYFVQGTLAQLDRAPDEYFVVEAGGQTHVLAHGRDPYFPPWTDTVQLDYTCPEMRAAMTETLQRIAGLCDGVRCDMAMLVTTRVFEQTWGKRAIRRYPEFWEEAIPQVKRAHPGFLFVAEVYWDMEWELQQQGFDFTYDKRLYDRLRGDDPVAVRDHLRAELDYQRRLLRFIENHDEPRAIHAFGLAKSQAAAALVATLPGMCLFHEGQLEGRRIKVPVQLRRRPEEPPQPEVESFYRRLLAAIGHDAFREGQWSLLETRPAGEDNGTFRNIVAYLWAWPAGHRLVAVNLARQRSQGYVRVPVAELQGKSVVLADLLGDATYNRSGDEMLGRGLYLDMRPYQAYIFEVTA